MCWLSFLLDCKNKSYWFDFFFKKVLEEGETKAVTTVGKKRVRLVEDILNKKPRNYTWGSLDIDEFIQKITQEGITDAKVEQVASGYIIHLVI